MAGTEDITLRVVLDDRQAKAGLEGLRNGTAGVAQAAAGAAGADGGGGGLAGLNDEMASLSQIGAATSSSLSKVGSSMGRLSPAAGKAIGALGGLAGALGAGGPVAIAILAAGQGISWLIGKYEETSRAAEAAEKAQVDAARATADKINSLTQGVQKRISQAIGIDDATIALGQMQVKVQEAQASLDSLLSEEGRTNFMWLQAENKNLENGTEAYAEAVEEAQQRLADLDIELANAEGAYREYSRQLSIATDLEERKKEIDNQAREALLGVSSAARDASSGIKKKTDALVDADGPARDYYDMLREQAEWEATTLENQRAAIDYINERRKAQEDYAASFGPSREMFEAHVKSQTDTMKQQAAEVAGIFKDTAGIVIGASDQLISDLITGQEKAFERFAVNIMRQAGTVMLGKGMELGANGIVNLMTGNPAGAGQLAVAAGLIGGGLALGAAATGIEHIAMGSGGSATTATAAAGPATTSTPMGAGRISGSQREPGSIQEAVTYVFNAPVFGDQNRSAKHVALLQRRASRDLLLA